MFTATGGNQIKWEKGQRSERMNYIKAKNSHKFKFWNNLKEEELWWIFFLKRGQCINLKLFSRSFCLVLFHIFLCQAVRLYLPVSGGRENAGKEEKRSFFIFLFHWTELNVQVPKTDINLDGSPWGYTDCLAYTHTQNRVIHTTRRSVAPSRITRSC